jgi:hypothetical protein
MILSAFGLVDASPIQISETLRGLNLSHTFVGGYGRTMHTTLDGLCTEQPVWPVVIDRVRNVHKVAVPYERLVYLVCDARAPLSNCNVSQALWPEHRTTDMSSSLINALIKSNELTTGQNWNLLVNEPTMDDYVSSASQPTFMNFLHGAVCKITPYALRKSVNQKSIAYLASSVSLTALRKEFRTSLKLVDVLALMESAAATNLRAAVQSARSIGVEKAAAEFGCETFEILYILRSFDQQSKG